MRRDSVLLFLALGFVMMFLFSNVSAVSKSRLDDFGTFNDTYFKTNLVTLQFNYSEYLGLLYHFDNQSEYGENDSLIYDFSGNGRNATIIGATINDSVAKYNSSIKIDNDGNDVSLDYIIGNETSFTINFWAYKTNWSGGYFSGLGEKGTLNNFVSLANFSRFRLRSNGNTIDSSVNYALDDNNWTMITVSCYDEDSDIARFYINGELLSSVAGICNGYHIDSFSLDSSGTGLEGNIDELSIYETVLSDSAILSLYENNNFSSETRDKGNYSQIYQSYNESENVSTDVIVKWKSETPGNSEVNVYACVGENYSDCTEQVNGTFLNILENSTSVKIVAELIADGGNVPSLEMLEPPRLIYYVDNQSLTCTDSNTIILAMNQSYPFCSIEAADNVAEADSEMVVKSGIYCDGIGLSNSGTEDYPIIVRAYNLLDKPFLNGTCANELEGIEIDGTMSYITFSGFEIFNFSNDAVNVHGSGVGVNLQNLVTHDNGYSQTTAAGDGVSYHDTSSQGIVYNVSAIDNYKSLVVDIAYSITKYYNLFGRNNRLYGIFFYGTGTGEGSTPNDVTYHEVHNATVEDSPGCFWSEVESHGYNITCDNITDKAIYLANRNNGVEGFIITNTSGNLSIKILDGMDYNITLKDGSFDKNISVINSSNVVITNVTYDESLESVDSDSVLMRRWYVDVSANVASANIRLSNSSSVIYSGSTSSSIPQQTLLSYVNNGGTKTYSSDYTITASANGYVSQSQTINLTENKNIAFTLLAQQSSTTSSGSSLNVAIAVPKDSLKSDAGYTRKMIASWSLDFDINGSDGISESHKLKLNSVGNESVSVTISSEPITFDIFVNETKKINLDSDNDYDLSVYLKSINGIYADLTIKEISEDIPENANSEEKIISSSDQTSEIVSEGNNFWIYFIVGLIIILLIVGMFVLVRKKRR